MSDDRHPWWENGHGEAYCPNCERDNKRIKELEATIARVEPLVDEWGGKVEYASGLKIQKIASLDQQRCADELQQALDTPQESSDGTN